MQVRALGRKGAAVLVEWIDAAGDVQRAYLPVGAVEVEAVGVETENPEQGIPYGEAWEVDLATLVHEATPEKVAQALRRQGVWTLDDLRSKPQAVIAAFQSAYGMDAQALREAARRRTKRGD